MYIRSGINIDAVISYMPYPTDPALSFSPDGSGSLHFMMSMGSPNRETELWNCLKVLPTDYREYGGKIKRLSPDTDYPDCSWGCKCWRPLYRGDCRITHSWDKDWGVCAKPRGPRAGLLTWKHQAGYGCFETAE